MSHCWIRSTAFRFRFHGALAGALVVEIALAQAPTETEPTRPGLVAEYRTLGAGNNTRPLLRIDAKPAFNWGDSSPHPRIPPGPFRVDWTGQIELKESEVIRFSAFLSGELKLAIDGVEIFNVRNRDTRPRVVSPTIFKRGPGTYSVRIQFQSLPETPARIQLWWEGDRFSLTPWPASVLSHAAAERPTDLSTEEKIEAGRDLARRFGCAQCHRNAFPSAQSSPPGPALDDLASRVRRDWLVAWLENPSQLRRHARMPKLFASDRSGAVEISLVSDYLLSRLTGLAPQDDSGAGDHRAGRQAFLGLGCAACHTLPDKNSPEAGQASAATEANGTTRTPLEDLADRFTTQQLAAFVADPRRRYPDGRMPRLPMPAVTVRDIAAYLLLWSQPTPVKTNRSEKSATGSTGDQPAPSGNLPDGTGAASLTNRSVGLAATPASVPVGRSPTGVGRLPASPILLTGSATEQASPTETEVRALAERLGVEADRTAIGAALLKAKRCSACHPGLSSDTPASIPLRLGELLNSADKGCLGSEGGLRFSLADSARDAVTVFAKVAAEERHASPFQDRQQLLERSNCFVCHQADGDSPAPLESIGQTLWTPHLMRLPYQRSPRLTGAVNKYTRAYLLESIRTGVSGVRPSWYSYRMPAFGETAEEIVRALAERDGESTEDGPAERKLADDPSLPMFGATLLGFEGYSCVSCHIWMGRELASPDPGAVGPELTTLPQRIRRDWFDRWMEDPARIHPGTPMPAFFPKGAPAPMASVLEGDGSKQKEALWAYLSQGTNAPSPQPRAAVPVPLPQAGEPPWVAQIPIRLTNGEILESLSLQYGSHDLVVYDLGKPALHSLRLGSRILRNPNGWRSFSFSETTNVAALSASPAFELIGPEGRPTGWAVEFRGFDRLAKGARLRFGFSGNASSAKIDEVLDLESTNGQRRLRREWNVTGLTADHSIRIKAALMPDEAKELSQAEILQAINWVVRRGQAKVSFEGGTIRIDAVADAKTGSWNGGLSHKLARAIPATVPPQPLFEATAVGRGSDAGGTGELERPGYRAFRYPMPKTASGEDRIMPSALTVDPKTGRLFVASLKFGELVVLDDPRSSVRAESFRDYAGGFFQDAYAMLHDGEALYVLHRRNLTRVLDLNKDGMADRFERVAALPHRSGYSYDWAYGLVRDRARRFVISFAPHADDRNLPGMGGILRLAQGENGDGFTEIGFGLRNAVGWAAGPNGEIFFSDNQGEWVAANKLCHVVEDRYYGYPNSARPETAQHPRGDTAVWIPYGWAKSINGIAYNSGGEKFGPFQNQFFMAELMHGGAIIRANVEEVNGVYQGACFPFWGRGLLGPLTLAFDPNGPLYVGGITQPAWMAQPDRGALFRIEFTGTVPFEIQSMHVRPSGFRLRFTKPIAAEPARQPASYAIEHYRYEYTGAYGSPEMDRTTVKIERIDVANDGLAVDLTTDHLIEGRIYSITASGVKAQDGETLVHPTGVYTLNQIPNAAQR